MFDHWVCAKCGYRSLDRFINDVCPHCRQTDWQCGHCGFTLTAAIAPLECISCSKRNCFANITGYVPEWHPAEALQGGRISSAAAD